MENTVQILKSILDILIVSYIIYRLIMLIKGTKAMHVIWGLTLIAIITAIAQFLHLTATGWLLKEFWLAGIILLIVVFQPEIRNALAHLGKSNPLGHILVSPDYSFIKQLMGAIRFCSKNKVGFLLALEQDIGLRDVIKSGVLVNAEISTELLLSIFNGKSPLHDGAVVISNNKIIAAGCIFPLTEEEELSRIFGMRHRAAIGLSESSDAVVLAVSEETGVVSIVRSGRMQSPVDIDELEKQLTDLYKSKAQKSLLRTKGRK
jgi:diadenylate cyclase